MNGPDYRTLRDPRRFSWSASAAYSGLLAATGLPIREVSLDPSAGIELYRRGRPLVREMYGEEVALPAPSTPAISYGHVNALGLELVFPEGGEVNYVRSERSLGDWLPLLARPVDWRSAGELPRILDYWERMKAAFPGERVGLSWGHEGPMTTAYELLDMSAFLAPHDDPEGFRLFLEALTASIVDFTRAMNRLRGEPEVNPRSGGLADDCASMFGPELWPAFVLPAWERHYTGITTGERRAHVEDLREAHLPFLERVGLVYYDPSVSLRLSPAAIARATRVPFGWRLVSFQYPAMSEADVRDWVFGAAADGASTVFTHVAAGMYDEASARKVHAFIEAAREAKRMIEGGVAREELRRLAGGGA